MWPVVGSTHQPEIPLSALRRFTVAEYHALIDAGFFAEDEDYELLRGLLVHKLGKNRAHSLATRRLRQVLETLLQGCYAESQEPVTTSDSEPEPDVSVIRGRAEGYALEQPAASSAILVAEVSDTTLAHDRRLKKAIYGEAGIPVYWIVSLVDRQIEVYSQPTGPGESPGYAVCQIFASGTHVPVVVDGREVGRVAVDDILP